MSAEFKSASAEELHGKLTARGGKNAEPNDEDACTLGCCNEQPEKVVVPGHPVFAHLLGDILASGRVPVGVATQDNAVQPGSLVFINTTERADFAQWYKESCEENSGRPLFGDFWKSPRG